MVCEGWAAALEDMPRRQPPKLSLRLSDEPEEGVSGSVEVDVCAESDVSFFCNGRRPPAFIFCGSTLFSLRLSSPLGREFWCTNSSLAFGNEFEEKGVVVWRLGWRVGMGMLSKEAVLSSGGCLSRRLTAELLLRIRLP